MFEGIKPSQYVIGYDTKFKEEETIKILEAGENAFLQGYGSSYITQSLMKELGMKYVAARALTVKMFKDITEEGKKRVDNMLEKNLLRLEHIYKRALENNDLKSALSAIDTMNKLGKLYTQKLEVKTDNYIIDLLGNASKENN